MDTKLDIEALKRAGKALQSGLSTGRYQQIPTIPGVAGPADVKRFTFGEGKSGINRARRPRPEDPVVSIPDRWGITDSTMTVSGGMPTNLFPPLSLDLAAKSTEPQEAPSAASLDLAKPAGVAGDGGAGGGTATPPPAAPTAQETPQEAKFRKAGLLDALQAMASGMIGRESEYSKQRAEFQGRQNALMAQAMEEASRLRLMAVEAQAQGDERKAERLFQASENAKDRAQRERLAAGEAGANGESVQDRAFRMMGESLGIIKKRQAQ